MFFRRSDTDKRFGVLLSDGCQPTSQQSSSHPSAPPTNALRTRETLETIGSSRSTTAQPLVPDRTASDNTSSVLAGSTQGGARQRTAETTPPPPSPPVSSSSLLRPTTDMDSTVNATTMAPEFTLATATTAGALKSPQNYTHLDNRTTPAPFPDRAEVHNVAADDSVSQNNVYNTATTSSQREQLTDAGTMSNPTGTTAGRNQTREDRLPTVTSPSNPLYVNTTATTETYKTENSFTVDNRNHHKHTNTSPYAAEYSVTTVTAPSNNATTQSTFRVNTADVDGNPLNDTATTSSTNTPSNHTASSNYLTQHNLTDSSKTINNTVTPNYTTTDANNFTHDHNHTAGTSVATAANADTTVSKNYNNTLATPTKPGMYSSKLLRLKMLRKGEEIKLNIS